MPWFVKFNKHNLREGSCPFPMKPLQPRKFWTGPQRGDLSSALYILESLGPSPTAASVSCSVDGWRSREGGGRRLGGQMCRISFAVMLETPHSVPSVRPSSSPDPASLPWARRQGRSLLGGPLLGNISKWTPRHRQIPCRSVYKKLSPSVFPT